MANEKRGEMPKPEKDIKVDDPKFKATLSTMINKKVDPKPINKKKT